MHLLDTYLPRKEFDNYEDFAENFQLNIPKGFNFAFDIVDKWAEIDPDKLALVYEDDFGASKSFTFKDIRDMSNRAANYLTTIGIKKGDVVMLTLKRRYQFWYIIIALHKIGAISVPATEMLKAKDFEYRFKAADVKMIISVGTEDVLDEIDEAEGRTHKLIKAHEGDTVRNGWVNIDEMIGVFSPYYDKGTDYPCDDDRMLMYFTSGTTGNPKIVTHNYTYPLGHITTAYYWHNCVDNGLHLSVAETGWAKCAWGKLYGQWICGSAVLVYDMERFVPEKLLDVMEKHPITTFCAPPTIFRFLIRCNMMYRDLSHIRDCTTAGEALNSEVYRIWLEKTGLKIREGFGQSESVIIAGTFKWMEPVPGSLGKPNPLFRLQLISDKGTEAEPGEEGQISIILKDGRATGLFIGYYGDEARTERTFADDIYYTGDLASVDKGGYLWYVGRADDVIKTSGYRVGPFEVESALMKHQSVLECAITGVPDEVRGQVIKASIVLNKGFTPSEELKKEIQDFVKHLTAPYKYPRVVEFLDELPKTTSGKVQRYVLRKNEEEKKTDKQSAASSRSMAEDWNRTVRELPSFLAKLFESHGFSKGSTVFDCSDNAVMGLIDAGYDVSVAKPQANEATRISMPGIGFKEEIFRRLSEVQGDEFDIIISMDNTLTHMPSKWDLNDVIEGIASRLGPKGMFVASIRDYDEVTTATTPFVQNTKNGQKIAFQTWTRTDNNYTLVQYIIEDGKELNINKVEYKYRAITREEMTSVLQDNGFEDVVWQMPADTGFYQPMVIALK